MKYSRKCLIEEIPPKLLEVPESNQAKTSPIGCKIGLGVMLRFPGHFLNGKLHGFHIDQIELLDYTSVMENNHMFPMLNQSRGSGRTIT